MAYAPVRKFNSIALPTPFSKNPYEYTVGFRRHWWLVLCIYALTCISINANNFNLGLFSLVAAVLLGSLFCSQVDIEKLSKSFGDKVVLDEISLQFKPGHITGIVGENGAEKYTLFQCIANLIPFNRSIKYSQGVLKNVCGFLPTNPVFLSKLTGNRIPHLNV